MHRDTAALWAPGTKAYAGRYVHLPETTCYPRPVGPLPILVGGGGERRTLRIVAEQADGCNVPSDPKTLPRKIEVLRRHCLDVGRDPADVGVTVLDVPIVGRDRDDVAARVERLRGRTPAPVFAARHSAGLAATMPSATAGWPSSGWARCSWPCPTWPGPRTWSAAPRCSPRCADRHNGAMDRAAVMTWVQGYEQAWRASDADAVPTLFTEDIRYRRSPYTPPLVGYAQLADFWTEDEGATFTMSAEPVAVEGDAAVVRVLVNYGGDSPQEYPDLWVMHFAADGRVDDFEEWAYWPTSPTPPRRRSSGPAKGFRVGAGEELLEHARVRRLVRVGRGEQGHRRAQLHRVDAAEDLLGRRVRCPATISAHSTSRGPSIGWPGTPGPRRGRRSRTPEPWRCDPARRSAGRRTTSSGRSCARRAARRRRGIGLVLVLRSDEAFEIHAPTLARRPLHRLAIDDERSGGRPPDPARWRSLAICLTASAMTLLDLSIVNVALPSLRASLGANDSDLQWIVAGYALAFGVVLVPAGRLGDAGAGGWCSWPASRCSRCPAPPPGRRPTRRCWPSPGCCRASPAG